MKTIILIAILLGLSGCATLRHNPLTAQAGAIIIVGDAFREALLCKEGETFEQNAYCSSTEVYRR